MAKSRKTSLNAQIRKLEARKKKADSKKKEQAEIRALEKKRDALRKQVSR